MGDLMQRTNHWKRSDRVTGPSSTRETSHDLSNLTYPARDPQVLYEFIWVIPCVD